MSAMLAAVDGAYLANQIRMLRSQDLRGVLVVEGPTDEVFFERLTDETRCRIDVAHGRENALDAYAVLRGLAGVLVVVDADFDVLEGRLPLPFGLLFTDAHDIEAMLIASPALDKLLRQVGNKVKIDVFRQKRGEVRERLLASGAAPGHLLWLSLRSGLHLKFEELNFGKFVDDRTLEVAPAKMVKAVLDHHNRHDLDRDAILADLMAATRPEHDPWHLCCGHHLTEILSIALRKALASHNAGEMSVKRVEDMLMLAYETVFFRGTPLYLSWERLSRPFRVLRDPS